MKLSVVIPFYFGIEGKNELLARCISSLKGHDELIVIGHRSQSLPWALNVGMRSSHGDYILVLSDDMYLKEGTLDSLCHYDYVTHPLVNGEGSVFGGAMCFPRYVWERVGLYDENFIQGGYDDDDMITRITNAEVERRLVRSVNMGHPEIGFTLKKTSNIGIQQQNKNYYERKWGVWEPASVPPCL